MGSENYPADLVIINATVITLNASNDVAEAIAAKKGRIISVGTSRDVGKFIGTGTLVLDLKGKTVLPGFIDTHVHLADFGLTLKTLNLENTTSIGDIQGLLKKRVSETPEGTWVMGRGWNEHRLKEGRLLTRWDMDEASPRNPVYLHHYTCHSCVVNSLGLEKAGIDKTTEPPSGGWIDKDEKGEPTGFLRSNARFLVPAGLNGYRPRPSHQGHLEGITIGAWEAVKYGITSLHILSADKDDIAICENLAKDGDLPLRVTLLPKVELLSSYGSLRTSAEVHDWVKLGAVKIFSDGSLIARTAAVSESFEGEPGNKGILNDTRIWTEQVLEANRLGLQIAIHATGDRAIEAVLDAYETALRDTPRRDHRHRIEHGSLVPERLVGRIKELGITISTQPEILTKYGDGFITSLGRDRLRRTYPFKSLLRSGVVVSGSSDCPLTYCSPLKGIQAAVTRISENTGLVMTPEERVSVDEAVRMYTVNAAYAGFDEKLKGTIEEGKFADLVVLNENPFAVPEGEIGGINVEMTIVDGKIVYERAR